MKVVSFYREVKAEVTRITWPSNKETVTSVILVLGMVTIASLFFLMIDSLLFKFVKLVLG